MRRHCQIAWARGSQPSWTPWERPHINNKSWVGNLELEIHWANKASGTLDVEFGVSRLPLSVNAVSSLAHRLDARVLRFPQEVVAVEDFKQSERHRADAKAILHAPNVPHVLGGSHGACTLVALNENRVSPTQNTDRLTSPDGRGWRSQRTCHQRAGVAAMGASWNECQIARCSFRAG